MRRKTTEGASVIKVLSLCSVAVQGSKGGRVSHLNIITELKKTCNHPKSQSLSLCCVAMQGSKGGQVSLLNIITELKKTCNHPFLFESAEEDYRGGKCRHGSESVLCCYAGK